jgi:hypothetical protein
MLEQIPDNPEKDVSFVEMLGDAVDSGNADQALRLLTDLDGRLIGANTQFQPHLQRDFLDFVAKGKNSCVVYLGDGGLSRLALWRDGSGTHVEVAEGVSATEVVRKWHDLSRKTEH